MMTSHSARTMREVSETVVIYRFLYFWNKFLVQIPWKGHFKSGKSSVLQARNRSFVRRGLRRKVPFFFSSTKKLSEVVQDIAIDALAPDSCQFFLKSCLQSLCVCNCRGIVFLTNPTVCLKSVFRPKKNSFLWASSQVLHKLTAVVGKVLPFEAFFWHLLIGGSFPSFATISKESCSRS